METQSNAAEVEPKLKELTAFKLRWLVIFILKFWKNWHIYSKGLKLRFLMNLSSWGNMEWLGNSKWGGKKHTDPGNDSPIHLLGPAWDMSIKKQIKGHFRVKWQYRNIKTKYKHRERNFFNWKKCHKTKCSLHYHFWQNRCTVNGSVIKPQELLMVCGGTQLH